MSDTWVVVCMQFSLALLATFGHSLYLEMNGSPASLKLQAI